MSQLTQASVRYEVSVMLVDEVTSEETSAVEKVPYNGVCYVTDSEQALVDKQTIHLVSAAAGYYVVDH